MSPQLDSNDLGSVSLEDIQDITSRGYIRVASLTFLLYDYLLTFSDELKYIWISYMTKGTYLFLFLRYFVPLSAIVEAIMTEIHITPEQCEQYNTAHQVFVIIIQVGLCFVLTIRTYALFMLNKRVLALMVATGCLLVGISIWSMMGQTSEAARPVIGCNIALSPETGARLATAWEALLAYDSLILALTLLRSYQFRDHGGALVTISIPVLKLVVRDGAVYYVVMVAVNLANILTFHLSRAHFRGVLTTFATSISASMISRLFLRLRSSAVMVDIDGTSMMVNTRASGFATVPVHITEDRGIPIELGELERQR